MLKKTVFLFLFALFFIPNYAFSEQKQLVCTDYDYQRSIKTLQSWIADGEKSKYPNKSFINLNKKRIENMNKVKWANKTIINFDTNGLKNSTESNAEFTEIIFSGIPPLGTKIARMTSTPKFIIFTYFKSDWKQVFVVDRKLLKAGFNDDRSYECIIKDIDVSENKL